MKVCVFGAGAIGGYLAAKARAAGKVELTLVARRPAPPPRSGRTG